MCVQYAFEVCMCVRTHPHEYEGVSVLGCTCRGQRTTSSAHQCTNSPGFSCLHLSSYHRTITAFIGAYPALCGFWTFDGFSCMPGKYFYPLSLLPSPSNNWYDIKNRGNKIQMNRLSCTKLNTFWTTEESSAEWKGSLQTGRRHLQTIYKLRD